VSSECLLCRSADLARLLDVGSQPISNRFLRTPTEAEERFPIALQQCNACGLVQIENPVPASALVPSYDWITYKEPEGHLDALVDILVTLPGIGPGSVAGGLSFKDDSTLARLDRKGLETWRLDLHDDLGVTDARSGRGVETVQDRLTPAVADEIVRHRAPADVLVVRHILEHASLPLTFLDALSRLVAPGGHIVVEVPDCSRAMDAGDYTTIWEEHTLYFTPDTFGNAFERAGLHAARLEQYPYPFENSLVAIVSSNGGGGAVRPASTSGRPRISDPRSPATAVERERHRGRAFADRFEERRDTLRRFLAEYRRASGPIALFGAGHLACTFVSLFGLEESIEFIVDDNPHKRGLYMPGSRLPIVESSALLEHDVRLCLLSLNPIDEEKVIKNNAPFVARGGVFASIFPSSERALSLRA
jgi:hypothetical protein